jgi:hypothetical protein
MVLISDGSCAFRKFKKFKRLSASMKRSRKLLSDSFLEKGELLWIQRRCDQIWDP